MTIDESIYKALSTIQNIAEINKDKNTLELVDLCITAAKDVLDRSEIRTLSAIAGMKPGKNVNMPQLLALMTAIAGIEVNRHLSQLE